MRIINAYLRLVARWRWSFLLTLLIGSFLLQPLLTGTSFSRLASFTLFIMVFGGALYAGRTNLWVAHGAVALMFLGLVLQVLTFRGVGNLDGSLTGLALIIVVGALVATFAELVGNHESTPDSLVGAIFGYFVIAAAFSLMYRHLEGAYPGSFRFPEGGDLDTQLLYFSIVTVTTVGYGDITPAAPVTQICAALEAAVGTLYIAILIGRIVGQIDFGARRQVRTSTDRAPSHAGEPRGDSEAGS